MICPARLLMPPFALIRSRFELGPSHVAKSTAMVTGIIMAKNLLLQLLQN